MGRNQNEENWTKTEMDESNSNDEYCKFSLTDTHEYRDNKKIGYSLLWYSSFQSKIRPGRPNLRYFCRANKKL